MPPWRKEHIWGVRGVLPGATSGLGTSFSHSFSRGVWRAASLCPILSRSQPWSSACPRLPWS